MTLIEQFIQSSYEAFLKEEEERELVSIYENHQKIIDAISAYQNLIALKEEYANLTEETLQEDESVEGILKQVNGIISQIRNGEGVKGTEQVQDADVAYTPKPNPKPFTYKRIDSITGFISGIITWVKNVLINLINFLTRGIRALVGLKNPETADKKKLMDPTKIIARAKKMAAIERQYGFGTIESRTTGNKDIDDVLNNYVKAEYEELASLKESANINEALPAWASGMLPGSRIYDEPTDNAPKNDTKANITYVNLDVSKELNQLDQALNRFYDLFEKSIGSNGEKLFETADLELLMNAFQRMIAQLEDTNDEGEFTSLDYINNVKVKLIDSKKLNDNYIRTRVNTNQLTSIYKQVQSIINNLLEVIVDKTNKQAVYDPTRFVLFSSLTFKSLANIVKRLNDRKKEAEDLSTKLENLGKKYADLVKSLEKTKNAWISVGSNITIQSEFERAVSDLFESSKYAFQTLILRFSCLSTYMNVLNETQDAIGKILTINAGNGNRNIDRLHSKIAKSQVKALKQIYRS